jgi:hypothetical protein
MTNAQDIHMRSKIREENCYGHESCAPRRTRRLERVRPYCSRVPNYGRRGGKNKTWEETLGVGPNTTPHQHNKHTHKNDCQANREGVSIISFLSSSGQSMMAHAYMSYY